MTDTYGRRPPRVRRLQRQLLKIIATEQEVIGQMLLQLKKEEEALVDLYTDIASRALSFPKLRPILSILRQKQNAIADKISSLAAKEESLASLIGVVLQLDDWDSWSWDFVLWLLRAIIDELKIILQILESIKVEEAALFDLFLKAIEKTRKVDYNALWIAREIAMKQESLSSKIRSLAMKQFALADKIAALLGDGAASNPLGQAIESERRSLLTSRPSLEPEEEMEEDILAFWSEEEDNAE